MRSARRTGLAHAFDGYICVARRCSDGIDKIDVTVYAMINPPRVKQILAILPTGALRILVEGAVKPDFACTCDVHLYRLRSSCGHRQA